MKTLTDILKGIAIVVIIAVALFGGCMYKHYVCKGADHYMLCMMHK